MQPQSLVVASKPALLPQAREHIDLPFWLEDYPFEHSTCFFSLSTLAMFLCKLLERLFVLWLGPLFYRKKTTVPRKKKPVLLAATMPLAAASGSEDSECKCPCHFSNQSTQTNLCIRTPRKEREPKKKNNNPNKVKPTKVAAPPAKVNLAKPKWPAWSAELGKTLSSSVLEFCNLSRDTKKICSNCVTKWGNWMKKNHSVAFSNHSSGNLPCLQEVSLLISAPSVSVNLRTETCTEIELWDN
jgi:hypothetical protein